MAGVTPVDLLRLPAVGAGNGQLRPTASRKNAMISATEKPKYVNQYLKQKIDEQLGGDASRFDELWERIPNLSDVLRSFNSDSNWLHWTRKTFDG
jgi:hypothetical protein